LRSSLLGLAGGFMAFLLFETIGTGERIGGRAF
jgi:hypothetical protein